MAENFEQFKKNLDQVSDQMEMDQTAMHNLINEWYEKAKASNHDEEVEKKLEEEYSSRVDAAKAKADESFRVFMEALKKPE